MYIRMYMYVHMYVRVGHASGMCCVSLIVTYVYAHAWCEAQMHMCNYGNHNSHGDLFSSLATR